MGPYDPPWSMNCDQKRGELEYLNDSTRLSDSVSCQLRWLWMTLRHLTPRRRRRLLTLCPWVTGKSRGFLPTWSGHAVWVKSTLLFQATEVLQLLILQQSLSYSEGYTYFLQDVNSLLSGSEVKDWPLPHCQPILELGLMSKIQHSFQKHNGEPTWQFGG